MIGQPRWLQRVHRWRLDRAKRLAFGDVGGIRPGGAEFKSAVQGIVEFGAFVLPLERAGSVHGDIVKSSEINAYVARVHGFHLIGVTDGIITDCYRMFERIEARFDIAPAQRDLMQKAFATDALTFAIGHELGHVYFGHLDTLPRTRGFCRMSEATGPTDLAGTGFHDEELKCDMVAALVLNHVELFRYRHRDPELGYLFETDAIETTLALKYAAAAAVFAGLEPLSAPVHPIDPHRYPHPLVRIIALYKNVRFHYDALFESIHGAELDEAVHERAFNLMLAFLTAIEPRVDSVFREHAAELRAQHKRAAEIVAADQLALLDRLT